MKRILLFILILVFSAPRSFAIEGESTLSAMKRATHYMMDVASYRGGFVWSYLPDYSRQWGELEAKRTMVWLQPPGTPAVGHLMLDAYHATTDEYYYQCAENIAAVLMEGQLPCGGWNYMFDLAGEESTKQWYATIGKQAWRLEEFQHYYGNATFDDGGTMEAAEFFLRMYLEKNSVDENGNNRYAEPLNKAINFVLESQYPSGGWPQRYPLMYDHPFRGLADYSSFITLNDDVILDAIQFLHHCRVALNRPELQEPVDRAMLLVAKLQQPKPMAGWADQYFVETLKPAHARSYEPRSVNTGTTAKIINTLISYYRQTGNKVFLQGIPDAVEWLRSLKVSTADSVKWNRPPRAPGDILVPRFIHPETGKALLVHRVGSNVGNGYYLTNSDFANTIAHYSSATYVNPDTLMAMYYKALSEPLAKLEELNVGKYYHKVYTGRWADPQFDSVRKIVNKLNAEGYWLTPIRQISNPYKPLPEKVRKSKDTRYQSTMVGDEYDTSPFTPDTPVMGISTQTFIHNMTRLIQSL